MEKRINLVLTGGHGATTAVATIQEIIKRHGDNWQLTWIGPKTAIEGKDIPTFSEIILPKLGVRYIPITIGRFQRKFSFWTIPSLFKIPFGFWEALSTLKQTTPNIIVSFGGYAALPVVVVGWFLRIPVIIHEQTVAVGLSNRLSSFFAKRVAIARFQSEIYFPKNKLVLVGNPVIAGIRDIPVKTKLSTKPTIYITGGSTGAQIINSVVDKALPSLLSKYFVIHQTGRLDYDHFVNKMITFPSHLRKNYEVYSFVEINEIADKFRRADLIIGRAGANTVAEIMVTARPAILIPIPWTRYDEQTKNALLAQENGNATIIRQENLTEELLLTRIEEMFVNWSEFNGKNNAGLSDLDKNAAKKFVDEIENLL